MIKWREPTSEGAITALQCAFSEEMLINKPDPKKFYLYALCADIDKLRRTESEQYDEFPVGLAQLDLVNNKLYGKIEGLGEVVFVDRDILRQLGMVGGSRQWSKDHLIAKSKQRGVETGR